MSKIKIAQTKVGSFKTVGEQKTPACGSKVSQARTATVLTHDQIAERAWEIWQNRGRIPGEDERNWHEAEAQLKAELGID